MSKIRPNTAQAFTYAADQDLEVMTWNPWCLQLDLDTVEDVAFMREQLRMIKETDVATRLVDGVEPTGLLLGTPVVTRSKSRKWHAYIRVNRALSMQESLLLHACLGSDRKRELLSFMRVLRGDAFPSMLFETKQWAGIAQRVNEEKRGRE